MTPRAPGGPTRALVPDRYRRALTFGIAAVLAGCSDSPSLRMLGETLETVTTGGQGASFKKQVESIQAPTLMVSAPDVPPSVLVLADANDHQLTWVSATEQTIVTRKGRIIRTSGLPRNLRETQGVLDDGLSDLPRLLAAGKSRARLELSLGPPAEDGLVFDSRLEVDGTETIRILGRHYDTVRVQERITVAAWRLGFRNVYWVDARRSYVWRTRQQFCPELPPLQLDLIRPPFQELV